MRFSVLALLLFVLTAASCGGKVQGDRTAVPSTAAVVTVESTKIPMATALPAATPKPESSTVLHRYVPDVAGAAYSGTGSCWASSVTSGREDAYRCSCTVIGINLGNIWDPCFTFQPEGGEPSVVCPLDPRTPSNAVVCSLAEPLPTPDLRSGDSIWFMVVEGRPCAVFASMNETLNGETFKMGCSEPGRSGLFYIGGFDCHPPEELKPGQWFANCASETSALAWYFVSEIWN